MDNKITLEQKEYLKDILKLYKMENCNTVATPIEKGCWVRNLLKEIGLKCNSFVIFVDNQSAIYVSKNPEQHRKLKHIDLKYHFIRDKVRKQIVVLRYICTDRQLADIFTKCLNREKFKKFCIDLNLLKE